MRVRSFIAARLHIEKLRVFAQVSMRGTACLLIAAAYHFISSENSTFAATLADAKVPYTLKFSNKKSADVQYEIEIGSTESLSPVSARGTFASSEVVIYLKPGTYYYHARAIGKNKATGAWSGIQKFSVSTPGLMPDLPNDHQDFPVSAIEEGIKFSWISGLTGTKYVLEIEGKDGPPVKVEVTGKDYVWMPTGLGEFKWKIGLDVAGVAQFSPARTFTISEKSRAPASVPPKSELKDEQKPPVEGRPQEWWVLGRLAQSVVAYNTNDIDTGVQGTGAALVGLMSAELRWRAKVNPGQVWTWSGAGNFEMIRQTVLNTTFSMPRFYGRVFAGRELGKFRVGGFGQLGYGESGIFVPQNSTTARKGKVTRKSLGLGGMAVLRATPQLFLSFIALGRIDTGGTSDAIPTPLLASPAVEAGFGASFAFTNALSLEGRIRLLQESFQWAPAKGGSANSSLTDNFIILDLGLGFKL